MLIKDGRHVEQGEAPKALSDRREDHGQPGLIHPGPRGFVFLLSALRGFQAPIAVVKHERLDPLLPTGPPTPLQRPSDPPPSGAHGEYPCLHPAPGLLCLCPVKAPYSRSARPVPESLRPVLAEQLVVDERIQDRIQVGGAPFLCSPQDVGSEKLLSEDGEVVRDEGGSEEDGVVGAKEGRVGEVGGETEDAGDKLDG